MKRLSFLDALGWYGMVAILMALFLISFQYLRPTNALYQFLTISGGAGLALSCYTKKDYPAFWLNLIYAAVAIAALIHALWVG